jgi:hypothetical protein
VRIGILRWLFSSITNNISQVQLRNKWFSNLVRNTTFSKLTYCRSQHLWVHREPSIRITQRKPRRCLPLRIYMPKCSSDIICHCHGHLIFHIKIIVSIAILIIFVYLINFLIKIVFSISFFLVACLTGLVQNWMQISIKVTPKSIVDEGVSY